jgi:ATP-dependent Clp protease adapter protein ClpS
MNNTEIKQNTDNLTDLLNELGIKKEEKYSLILWNDHVNDMLHIIISLIDICKLNNDEAVIVMLEAHTKGKSVIKSGSFDEINDMKKSLNKRNIEATIEEC